MRKTAIQIAYEVLEKLSLDAAPGIAIAKRTIPMFLHESAGPESIRAGLEALSRKYPRAFNRSGANEMLDLPLRGSEDALEAGIGRMREVQSRHPELLRDLDRTRIYDPAEAERTMAPHFALR
jgi:hypothetical protein